MEILKFSLQVFTLLFTILALGVSSFLTYLIFKKGKEIEEKFLLFTEKNKFILAAIDTKLSVAQEAFKRSLNFTRLAHENARISTAKNEGEINEVFNWWSENCLFLSDNVRREFYECYINIINYDNSLKLSEKNDIYKQELKDKFNRLRNLPNVIEQSINFYKLDYSDIQEESITN